MQQESPDKNNGKRKYLGIYFRCCNVYARIYINNQGSGYEGRCPRCGKKVDIAIGKGGVENRFFEAY